VSPEPPPQDHSLLSLSPAAKDRLLMTPHIGGITRGPCAECSTRL
jgi:phosphoglycerate dehydrogenase-like enzyme